MAHVLHSVCRSLCASLCALVIAGCSSTAPAPAKKAASTEPAMPSVQEFSLGEHGKLGFLLPPGWIHTPGKITSPLIPGSFRVDTIDKTAAVQVSVSWDGLGPKPSTPTDKDLELKLRVHAGYQHVRTSVEKQVTVKPFKGTQMTGFYAQFTEAQWTNVEVPAGVYPIVTEGVFRTGNLWGTFTIYSRDKGEAFSHAFAMVRSFRKL